MSAQEHTAEMNQDKVGGRGPFWGLLIVTGLPFLLALYLFYHPELVARLGTTNHGQLIQPPRALPALQLQTPEGGTVAADALQGKWTLLMVADSGCSEACQKNLYYLRQIRRAMGKDRYHVARVMVPGGRMSSEVMATKLEPFEGTLVVFDSARGAVLDALRVDAQTPVGRMYIADPKGMLILAYPPNPAWRDVLRDLERLLKVVQQ